MNIMKQIPNALDQDGPFGWARLLLELTPFQSPTADPCYVFQLWSIYKDAFQF